jgi:hypothetical protein
MKVLAKALMALCLLMYISSAFAADTLKIHLTYKHRLDNQGRTQGYITVSQKFYTPEEQLFREIKYNEQSGQIADYTFYFYTDGKLFTEECYSQNDSLMYILKHGYDAEGRDNLIVRLEPRYGGLEATGKTVNSYDKSGRLHQQKIYFGKKAGSITSYVYNKDGNLQSENRKFKPVSNQSLKAENRSFSYGADKKLDKVSVTGKVLTGQSFQRSEAYSYDDKGKVSSVSVTGNDLPDGLVKTYKYLASGLISLYEESNAAGKYSLILQYDYKKHYMDRGTQVSYFASGK